MERGRLLAGLGAGEQRDSASRDEGDGHVRGSPTRIGRNSRRRNEWELWEAIHGGAAKTNREEGGATREDKQGTVEELQEAVSTMASLQQER